MLGSTLAITLALSAGLAPAVETIAVPGHALDLVEVRAGSTVQRLVTTTVGARRALYRIDGGRAVAAGAVPDDAVFVDSCPLSADGSRLVYLTPRGLIDAKGAPLLETPALFVAQDPRGLVVADLCAKSGTARGELRMMTPSGLVVARAGQAPRTLALRPRARVYSGRVHRGLRPQRPYDVAASVYAPRLFDVDLDADGDTDLVTVHEGALRGFRRGPDGALETAPVVDVDLSAGQAADADLRVLVDDLDEDGRADALVGVTSGPIPETSRAFWLRSTKTAPLSTRTALWSRDGFVAPIATVTREGKTTLVVSEVDTSLVALGQMLVSGAADIDLELWRPDGETRGAAPGVSAAIDLRAGAMAGSMPIVTVDLDGDGLSELVDLGVQARARVFPGTAAGFSATSAATLEVPTFVHVVATDDAIALIGHPRAARGAVTTPVALLRHLPAPPPISQRGRRR